MNGRIEPGVVPKQLRDIYVGRLTGMLHFVRGQEHCSIRFAKGHIVYGSASDKSLHMGQVLVAQGLLSEENLARATELVVRERKRLGQALESLGLVDSELLEEFLAIHVREILVHVFSWREGSFTFEEQDSETKLEYDFPLKMSTGEAIMEAVRQVEDRQAIQFALGDLDRVLLASTEPLVRFQRVTLTPIDGFVLSRIDGTLSAREAIQITPLDSQAVEHSLAALLAAGIVEYAPKPLEKKPASAQFLRQEILDFFAGLRDRDHFELLGLPRGASEVEIEAAYARRAKRYHPDVHHDPALGDLQDKLEGIFFRLNEAHRVLSDPLARTEYLARLEGSKPVPSQTTADLGKAEDQAASPPPPRVQAVVKEATDAVKAVQAEDLFATAEEHFSQGRYWEAMALLVEVVRLAEGRLRSRARMLLARAYLKHPDKERDAETELKAVIADDPNHADARFYLATIFRRRGQKLRAQGELERVLKIKPSHREAIAELDSLRPKPPAPEPGHKTLLKKLFG